MTLRYTHYSWVNNYMRIWLNTPPIFPKPCRFEISLQWHCRDWTPRRNTPDYATLTDSADLPISSRYGIVIQSTPRTSKGSLDSIDCFHYKHFCRISHTTSNSMALFIGWLWSFRRLVGFPKLMAPLAGIPCKLSADGCCNTLNIRIILSRLSTEICWLMKVF